MSDFEKLCVPKELINSLFFLKIKTPTEIQEKSIPIAITGRDIIGSAQTGTGKTLAFLLPLLTRLLKNEINQAIIVEPTRELAQQVLNTLIPLVKNNNYIKYSLLIGGEPYTKQLKSINQHPQILICTPGRIIDHLKQKNISLEKCDFVVIDETDRLFDMGFKDQIEEIFNYIPSKKQTLMFSATFSPEIEDLINKHMSNPEKIYIQADNKANKIAETITEEIINLDQSEKYSKLIEELKKNDGNKIIVFVRTKSDVEYFSYKLKNSGFRIIGIHGDMRQNKRKNTIKLFKNNTFNILIGTDIIARGLDIPNVKLVINYNIPDVPEDYIHRIGRTGRAGEKGNAISLVSKEDERNWLNIQKMLHPEEYKDIKIEKKPFSKNKKHYRRWNNNYKKRHFYKKDKTSI